MAVNMLPGLPAYVLFMMIRYTDYVNNDENVRSLIQGAISLVKKVVKKKGMNDLEVKTLWLSNMLRILHNLKQYSGEHQFQNESTPKQVRERSFGALEMCVQKKRLPFKTIFSGGTVLAKLRPLGIPPGSQRHCHLDLSGKTRNGKTAIHEISAPRASYLPKALYIPLKTLSLLPPIALTRAAMSFGSKDALEGLPAVDRVHRETSGKLMLLCDTAVMQ